MFFQCNEFKKWTVDTSSDYIVTDIRT